MNPPPTSSPGSGAPPAQPWHDAEDADFAADTPLTPGPDGAVGTDAHRLALENQLFQLRTFLSNLEVVELASQVPRTSSNEQEIGDRIRAVRFSLSVIGALQAIVADDLEEVERLAEGKDPDEMLRARGEPLHRRGRDAVQE